MTPGMAVTPATGMTAVMEVTPGMAMTPATGTTPDLVMRADMGMRADMAGTPLQPVSVSPTPVDMVHPRKIAQQTWGPLS